MSTGPFTVARSRRRTLGAAILVGTLGGAAAGLYLAVSIAAVNGWGVGADLLLLTAYLSGLYALVSTVGLGSTALVLLAFGGRPGPRVFLALFLGFWSFLSGVLRYNPAIQIFSVVPGMSAVGVIDVAVLGCATLAVMMAILSAALRRALAAAFVAVALLGGLQAFHLWHERPPVRDLEREIPPLLAQGGLAPAGPRQDPFENTRMVVLGFDGLTWEVLLPLLRRGELPNFREVLRDAAYGYLETLPSAFSPVVWETIASGQPPARHGIGHHVHFEFSGVSDRVRLLPNFRLCNTPLGLRRLLVATTRIAPWKKVPAASYDARVARFWEIVSRSGVSVGVYGWLNTTPAAPLNGFLHGHGVYEPIDFPPDLEADLLPLPVDHGNIRKGAEWAAERRRIERGLWDRFVALALWNQPEVLMYYTHFGDSLNHLNWKLELVGEDIFFGGWSHPDFEPGPAITIGARFLDDLLGDVLSRLPAQASLVVVSDHGFEFRGYEHDNAPPGVLILRGPGIRPGMFTGASVFDVTPTLLHLLGQPVADDMDGGPLPVALPGGPLDRPPQRIASYGRALVATGAEGIDREKLGRQREYLRALGYVVD